jgi:hypothetical protein
MARPNDFPPQERLSHSERALDFSLAAAKTVGNVVLAAVEGAIDGAVNSLNIAIDSHKQSENEKSHGIFRLESHANNPDSHKNL